MKCSSPYCFNHHLTTSCLSTLQYQAAVGWSLAALTGVLVVFGMWDCNYPLTPHRWTPTTAVVYGGLHRTAWAAAVAWVVWACHKGYGGGIRY